MAKHPLTLEEFESIYSRVARVCVDPIVRTPSGIILSLRKGNIGWNGQWHLPGGTIRYRERIEDALHRIMKDELGIAVAVEKLLGYIECMSEEGERGFGYSVSFVILCDLISGTPRADEDASEVKAFKELPENLIVEHKEFLNNHWQEIYPS